MAPRQSPVDIAGDIAEGAPNLEFAYNDVANLVTNTGDFIKVKYEEGGGIQLNGRMYKLSEIHAHNPGEHTIDGERFALETHLVHTRDSGEIAVVGILYRFGDANSAIQSIIANAPGRDEYDAKPHSPVTPGELIPTDSGYYAYSGSLTTPPYTEGVQWIVMSDAQEVSEEQVTRLAALTGGGTNSRAIQPLNGRQIAAFGVS